MQFSIPVPWTFSENVSQIFDKHVRQSIPDYDWVLYLLSQIVGDRPREPKVFLDLGTGTGAALAALQPNLLRGDRLIGIDQSSAMLQRAGERRYDTAIPEFIAADLSTLTIQPHDMTILTFTLSFVEPSSRHDLLTRIFRAQSSDGFIFLADKLRYSSAGVQHFIEKEHSEFKRHSGVEYADLRKKKESLVGVQEPWTVSAYEEAVLNAGWRSFEILNVRLGFFAAVAFG